MLDTITKYFPNLSEKQISQFEQLLPLYQDWNSKINVVSRKDIDLLYERHVLHSLAIAKVAKFKAGTSILDLGTGGGFPAIPLAIFFPEVKFTAVDSIGKKIKVVNEVAQAIGLENIVGIHSRVEDIKTKHDYVVSRAVAELQFLLNWSKKLISQKHINVMPNGFWILKGGNIREEIKVLKNREYIETFPIPKFFKEEFFEEKYVLYVQG
jgi:16S rRNA (guanine527-N7)-methyltransferase